MGRREATLVAAELVGDMSSIFHLSIRFLGLLQLHVGMPMIQTGVEISVHDVYLVAPLALLNVDRKGRNRSEGESWAMVWLYHGGGRLEARMAVSYP